MKNWKTWLSGLAGVVVTVVAMNLGVPAPLAAQIGNEAKNQLNGVESVEENPSLVPEEITGLVSPQFLKEPDKAE